VPRNQGDIAEIDGLRGLAIFAVMVHRLWPRDAVNRLSVAADAGWIGVDLFFVVSGFLITRILLETRNDPQYFRNFYARRVLRIFPLYYLFVGTLLVVFPLAGNSAYLDHSGSPFWYLTFLGNMPEALLGNDPPYWLAPVWSLAIEEQFYLTFPWIVLWLGPERLGRFLVGLFLFAPVVRLATMLAWPDQERIQYLFTLCRVDAIAAGCMVALIMRWRHAHSLRDLAIVVALCAGAVAIIGDLDRTTSFGRVAGYSFVAVGFAALLVAVMNGLGTWWTSPLRFGPLRYAGRLCFGLYLLHRPADTITTTIATRFDVDADRISWIPIKIAVAFVLATLSWLVLEKPMLRLKRFFVSSRHPSAGTAIATGAIVLLVAGCNVPGTIEGGPDARGDDVRVDAATDGARPDVDPDVLMPPAVGHVVYVPGLRHSPITDAVAARLQSVASSASPRVFAKVGDSITDTPTFLRCFDGGTVDYGAHASLAANVDYYMSGRIASASPFARISEAAEGGWTTADLLAGSPCGLERELAAANPALSFVMLGTNDNRYGRTLAAYVGDLWTAVDQMLLTGSIPVLSTIPPMQSYPDADARVPLFNLAVRAIAQGRQVPLVDLYGALAPLANQGLSSDGIHPSVSPAGACVLTSAGLAYGYNVRNLVTVEALARVQGALSGVASDATANTRSGMGTDLEPYRAPLPVTDIVDTRDGGMVSACGNVQESAVYEVDISAPRVLQIDAIGRAQSIAVVVGGTCLGTGSGSLSVAVPAGSVRIIVRGGSGESVLVAR
jgi:peptidoglycan/LPS O-acetylase OafA/YrhL